MGVFPFPIHYLLNILITLLLSANASVTAFVKFQNRSILHKNYGRLNFKLNSNKCVNEESIQNRPIVLVGLSGAGNELPRLANSVIELTSGMTSAEIGLMRTQIQEEGEDKKNNEEEDDMLIDCGVMEPIGMDDMGLWTYDTEIFDELILGDESLLSKNDVILLDMGGDMFEQAYATSSESSKQLENKYMELLQHLHYKLNCLVIYVNVHPVASNMTPRSASAAISLHEKMVEYSNREIVIYDEGLSAAAILARDAMGDTKGDGLPKRDYGSFDSLQSDLEKQDSNDKINNQIDAWLGVLWDLKRHIIHARSGQIRGNGSNLKLFGRDTFFTSLTFGDMRDASEYMPSLCPDTDAMEFRSDLINIEDIVFREGLGENKDSSDNKSTKNIRSFEGRFHMMRQISLLRRMCRPHSVRVGSLEGVMHDVMPIVFTVRTANQAGTWPDSKDAEINDMLYLLELGLRSGVEVLDVEAYWKNDSILDLARTIYPETVILGSHHVVGSTCTDEETTTHFEHCFLKGKADALKVVLSIDDPDNADQADRCGQTAVANIIEKCGKDKGNVPFIGLVLADVGKQSRILNRIFTPVTHESLPFVAAPGQLSTRQIMEQRIVQNIIEKQDYCILGHNIAYSVSPQMHNAAFNVCQLPHEYGRMDVETVEEFVNSPLFKSRAFGGASVTIPHKQSIMSHLDKITPSASKIGAVNTILVDRDSDESKRVLIGDNTDWIGIYNPIKRLLRSQSKGCALILGAGGTARAAAYAAQELGLECVFCNRTPEKAKELVDSFGGFLLPSDLNSSESEKNLKEISRSHGDVKVVMSTLPVAAAFEFPLWFVKSVTSSVVVLDVNYKPYNTPLINQCLSNGSKFKIVRGSDMLWEQGVQQFERWMERIAPYKVMRDVVLENCMPVPMMDDNDDA